LAVRHWRESFRDLIVATPAAVGQGATLTVSTMISRKVAETRKSRVMRLIQSAFPVKDIKG
jgi:hypothetical protein